MSSAGGRATRRRVAVIGCRDGAVAIALALANPHDVIAGFDADPVAVAAARRAAARHRVSNRVTFEAAAPNRLLGSGYDIIVMIDRQRTTQRNVGVVSSARNDCVVSPLRRPC